MLICEILAHTRFKPQAGRSFFLLRGVIYVVQTHWLQGQLCKGSSSAGAELHWEEDDQE